MDDATDVCLSYYDISQWAGPLLGDFQCYSDCYAVLYYRVGGLGYINGWEEGSWR